MKDKDQVDTVGAVIANDDQFIITENEVRNYEPRPSETINGLSLTVAHNSRPLS